MKKNWIQVRDLLASDFPACVRPFYVNAKSAIDPNIGIKMAIVAIVCYGALSPRLRVQYYYNYLDSMILLNALVISPTGKGKSTIRIIVNMLMKLLFDFDRKERTILAEWRKENKRKAANARKDAEPNVAIRYLQKFTLPIAVKYADMIRLKYGDILPFFLAADELGSVTENKRATREFASVARTAYNMGEEYVRDTLYDGGYNGNVDICWNSVLCGQPDSVTQYITKEGVRLGDASRQILITMGDEVGSEPPKLKTFTQEQMQTIDDTIHRLWRNTFTDDDQLKPTHKVDMSWLDKDVIAWCNHQREIIDKSESKAHDSFYGRASESAFRLATVLYYLWGEDKTKQKKVRKCYYFFAQFILDGIMKQWGRLYEAGEPKDEEEVLGRPTLYDALPKRFTRKMIGEKAKELGINCAPRKSIYKWKTQRHWIVELEGESEETFEKIYE